MKKIFIFALFITLVLIANNAFAIPLAGEYSIITTVTPIDSDSWIFSETAHNT